MIFNLVRMILDIFLICNEMVEINFQSWFHKWDT